MTRDRAIPLLGIILALFAAGAPAWGQEGEGSMRRMFGHAGLGIAGQGDTNGGHLSRLGVSAVAGLDWRWTRRSAVTLDLGVSSFWKIFDHIHAPCPDEFACHEPTGSVNVGSLVAAVTYAEVPHDRPGMYVLGGGGIHRALSHPKGFDAVRPGFTLGLGVAIPHPRLAWRIDLRAHVIDDWAGQRWVFVPMTFALTF
jgi:hypothetical protein